MQTNIPIIVDLDGTLVYDDTLYVLARKILREQPLKFLMLPFKLLNGKAAMKQFMSSVNQISAQSLKYNSVLIDWLKAEKQTGRPLILCTASNSDTANAVADHLKIFDEVIGSDEHINLSGHAKANELITRYGDKMFDYCGNAPVDLKVWKHAKGAVVVNANQELVVQAEALCSVLHVFK